MGEKFYEVVVRKCLWTHEEHLVKERSTVEPKPKVAIFTRKVMLPFVPFVGLHISDGIWGSGPLRSVIWHVQEGYFSCETGDDFPRSSHGLSYDDLMSVRIEQGWERPEHGGGNAPLHAL